MKLPALDCLLRPEERSVGEDRLYALQECAGSLEDPEEEEDWGDTGKPQESVSRYRVRALGGWTDMGGGGKSPQRSKRALFEG